MVEPLHKFPSTPHLLWLGKQPVRDDKVMTPHEVAEFLACDVTVEEKIDGANLGISVDGSGTVRFQNRGNLLGGKLTGQWTRLRGWAAEHETMLRDHLPPAHVLFGEWCYARHSIEYDHLPDWFLAFDIYDSQARRFLNSNRRDILLERIGIQPVPRVASGRFEISNLLQMLESSSACGHTTREGLYLRHEADGWLVSRAKLVRPEFIQQIGDHWSKGHIHSNRLAAGHPIGSR